MAEGATQRVLVLGVIAVGVFLVARALFTAQPVQAATQALTPKAPEQAGLVLRGTNYSAFVPFPNIESLLNSMATSLRPTEEGGMVSVQPGQRMQFITEATE
jgi:hypothetical protein